MSDEAIMNDDAAVVTCEELEKTYSQGPQLVHVLKGVNLQVRRGERIAIVGSSGSGKTTLLNLLGGLDLPTSGTVSIAGKDLAQVDETERGLLRNKHLGFVYQFHHLLGEFTALENVCMPLLIAGMSMVDAAERARSILGRVGLAARVEHKPSELSGGERQRVRVDGDAPLEQQRDTSGEAALGGGAERAARGRLVGPPLVDELGRAPCRTLT